MKDQDLEDAENQCWTIRAAHVDAETLQSYAEHKYGTDGVLTMKMREDYYGDGC